MDLSVYSYLLMWFKCWIQYQICPIFIAIPKNRDFDWLVPHGRHNKSTNNLQEFQCFCAQQYSFIFTQFFLICLTVDRQTSMFVRTKLHRSEFHITFPENIMCIVVVVISFIFFFNAECVQTENTKTLSTCDSSRHIFFSLSLINWRNFEYRASGTLHTVLSNSWSYAFNVRMECMPKEQCISHLGHSILRKFYNFFFAPTRRSNIKN